MHSVFVPINYSLPIQMKTFLQWGFLIFLKK